MSAHETMSQAEWAEWQAAAPKTVGIGDKLANGATVLQVAPASLHLSDVVFLALWRGEFVTWIGDEDGTGTSWGHYFPASDLSGALADFAERSVSA